jgi:hypothetical protein
MIDDALLTKTAKEMYGVLKRDLHHPKEWDELSPDKQEVNKRAAQAAIDTFLYLSSREADTVLHT